VLKKDFSCFLCYESSDISQLEEKEKKNRRNSQGIINDPLFALTKSICGLYSSLLKQIEDLSSNKQLKRSDLNSTLDASLTEAKKSLANFAPKSDLSLLKTEIEKLISQTEKLHKKDQFYEVYKLSRNVGKLNQYEWNLKRNTCYNCKCTSVNLLYLHGSHPYCKNCLAQYLSTFKQQHQHNHQKQGIRYQCLSSLFFFFLIFYVWSLCCDYL
jgi:hypothetical protein